VIQQGG